MGTTMTRERTVRTGQQFKETFKMVSDGSPAAQTVTSERNLPIRSWNDEGSTVAAVAGTQSQLTVTPPASKTIYFVMYTGGPES